MGLGQHIGITLQSAGKEEDQSKLVGLVGLVGPEQRDWRSVSACWSWNFGSSSLILEIRATTWRARIGGPPPGW